ncbi:MAG TPA: thioredoxin domain-containing protein [Polyangiaceae bacterium]|nr:thioredoxin domain-containing protein [Polyangiaceae bacterium]
MNKGTAIVGFFLCFMAGMGLMWGIDRSKGTAIGPESASVGGLDHSESPVPVTEKDPIWGNADAPVTIVEISDFECPFCSRVGPTMDQIKKTYGPDKVRIVWKHQPLPFHKAARPVHEAAATVHALAGNDAFWKFHDKAFANQRALTEENIQAWAKESGVDMAKFNEAYKAKKYAAKVDEDMAMATKVGATGTPAFRINGVTLVGAQPFEKFKEVIDAQLGEAQKAIAAGTPKDRVYVELSKKNATAAPEAAAPDKPAEPPPPDTAVWKVPVFNDDPQKGPKDALVTIVEWSEFQCPFCKRVLETGKQITDTYGKDVRIVWKDNPLPFHPRAKPTAVLARHAYKVKGDDGFWAAHDALFESQPKLEDEDLKAVSEKIGLPWDAVKAAIDGNKYMDKIDANAELAQDVEARGTPHFFVNGRRLSGAQPFDAFKKLIDEELGKAKALVAKGIPRSKVYEEIMKEGKEPPPPEKKDVAKPDADSPWKGGAAAKVVIQEFSDYQCPFCKRVEPTMDEIKKAYGNKVKIVWRDLPLPFHQDAPLAAEACREAMAQKGNDTYWKCHAHLFENQQDLKRPALEKMATDLGLDMAKFKAALDNRTHKARVERDTKIGNDAGISGTPAFVINGYYISGAQPFPAFKKAIDRALKEAK